MRSKPDPCFMLVMFVLTLLLNLRAVRRTKLIELMGAERRNESIKTRNPGLRLPSLSWAWRLWKRGLLPSVT